MKSRQAFVRKCPTKAELRGIVLQVIRSAPLPRLLELYYWTQEPGIPSLIRGLAAFPPEILGAISVFVDSAAGDPSLTARWRSGALELRARRAKDTVTMLNYMLEDDEAMKASNPKRRRRS